MYIFVEVYLPAAEKTFDIKIPRGNKIWEIKKMVSAALTELSDGRFWATDKSVLIDGKTGAIYNINLSVEEVGLTNGSKLILI